MRDKSLAPTMLRYDQHLFWLIAYDSREDRGDVILVRWSEFTIQGLHHHQPIFRGYGPHSHKPKMILVLVSTHFECRTRAGHDAPNFHSLAAKAGQERSKDEKDMRVNNATSTECN